MRILLACAVVALSAQTALCDVVKYESATGNTNNLPGWSIASDQFLGSRFTFNSWTRVRGIGGTFAFASNPIFAAIVNMSGPLPQGSPFNGTEVLLSTLFTPASVGDDITPVFIDLPAGDYALVFGNGLFGATGSSAMPFDGTNTAQGAGSYFFWNGGGGAWVNGSINNARFIVLGVPEPSAAALLGLGTLVLLRRRRK